MVTNQRGPLAMNMKVSASVFTVLVFVGCALGDGGGCSIVAPDGSSVYEILRAKVDECLSQRLEAHMNPVKARNGTIEEGSEALKRMCSESSETQRCLDSLVVDEETCVTGVERTRVRLLRALREVDMDVACMAEGEPLAVIYDRTEKLHREAPGSLTVPEQCKRNATAHRHPLDEEDPNTEVIGRFRDHQAIKECLKNHPQDELVATVLSMTRDVLDKIKCVHPNDGTLVLCKTIFS